MRFGYAGIDILGRERGCPWQRMRPLRCGQGAAAVVVAALGGSDRGLRRFRDCRIVAAMRHANAAGVGWRRRGRQCERNKHSDKREQQEESGGQALHVFRVNEEPQVKSE